MMDSELSSRTVIMELCRLLRCATNSDEWLSAEGEFFFSVDQTNEVVHLAYRKTEIGRITRRDLARPLDEVSNLLQPMVWTLIVENSPTEVLNYWTA